MGPDQVIDRLSTLGVKWSRSTLLRAVKDGLGPEPKTGAGGRGYGRWSDYPDDAFSEFYASHILMKKQKMKPEAVAKAREAVLWFRMHSQSERVEKKQENGFNFSRIFGVSQKKLEKKVPLDLEQYHECAALLHSTEGALEWWELKQAAFSHVDNDYAELLENENSSSGLAQTIIDFGKWIAVILKILLGVIYIAKMEYHRKWRVLAWIRLISNIPELKAQTRVGVVAEFSDIPEAAIQFFATKQLPDPGVLGVMDPLSMRAEFETLMEKFDKVNKSKNLDSMEQWVNQWLGR